MENYR
ncbi:hypothetical protein BsWGS_01792 [Bradybaena similaris]